VDFHAVDVVSIPPDSLRALPKAERVDEKDVRLARSARLRGSDAIWDAVMRTGLSFLVESITAAAPSVMGEQSRRRSGSATRGLFEMLAAGISLRNWA
jgi:hypothetical protein